MNNMIFKRPDSLRLFFGIVFFLCIIGILIYTWYVIFTEISSDPIIYISMLFPFFFSWDYLNTKYILQDNELIIKSIFSTKRCYAFNNIDQIIEDNNSLSAHVHMSFKDKKTIFLIVGNQKEFVKHLRRRVEMVSTNSEASLKK